MKSKLWMYTISFNFPDRLQRQNFQGSMASSGGESGDGGVNDCSIDSVATVRIEVTLILYGFEEAEPAIVGTVYTTMRRVRVLSPLVFEIFFSLYYKSNITNRS